MTNLIKSSACIPNPTLFCIFKQRPLHQGLPNRGPRATGGSRRLHRGPWSLGNPAADCRGALTCYIHCIGMWSGNRAVTEKIEKKNNTRAVFDRPNQSARQSHVKSRYNSFKNFRTELLYRR